MAIATLISLNKQLNIELESDFTCTQRCRPTPLVSCWQLKMNIYQSNSSNAINKNGFNGIVFLWNFCRPEFIAQDVLFTG